MIITTEEASYQTKIDLIPGKLYRVKFDKKVHPGTQLLTFTRTSPKTHGLKFLFLKEEEIIMFLEIKRPCLYSFLIGDSGIYALQSHLKRLDKLYDNIHEWIEGPLLS